MEFDQQLRLWADELHAIANEGLRWSAGDIYHIRRYERVVQIAAALLAAQGDAPASVFEQALERDTNHASPDLGGDGAIFNDTGEILLIERRDNGLWSMPGGLIEVGETPVEGTCREVWEETGIAVRPLLLVGVYDSRRVGLQTRRQLVQFVLLCEPIEQESQPVVTAETLDARYFALDALPALAPGHATGIADAFRAWEGQRSEAKMQ